MKTGLFHHLADRREKLQSLANKCEKLSREYTAKRDLFCQCLDPNCFQTNGLDWCHGISRGREEFKYHPDNTFRLCHEHHLAIDHSSNKHLLMDQLQIKRIGVKRWEEIKNKSSLAFIPTEEFYIGTITMLQELIREV